MFGHFLLKHEVVSGDALTEALDVQRFRARPVGRILRELGYLSQDELNRQLHLYTVPKAETSLKELAAALKERIERGALSREVSEWAATKGWLLFEQSSDGVTFLAPWFRDDFIEEAETAFRRPCKLIIVSGQGLNLIQHLAGLVGEKSETVEVATLRDERAAQANGPYVALFQDVLDRAQKEGASDIHIQPERDFIEIRLRVNGDMEVIKKLAVEHRQSFINEAKRLCGLSIAQSGEAQDGRVSLPVRKLDLRTSLIPTQYGEKIVLRLLDLSREFNLDRSGLDRGAISELRDALRAKNGVVIVSGPTGSGKTTLLYTLLCALDRVGKNVITLEDPIEYSIAGLTQVQVTPKLSFAKALRSILRQDPDVILVGEIRDSETADLCVKAASTGHLVLSTLHANSAAEVVARLLNLGVDRYMLKSCLRFSAAQRLIKKLCPRCSTAAPASVRAALNELCLQRKFRVSKDADLRTRNAAGCSECRQGVIGRIPVLEYLKAVQVGAYLTDTPGSDSPSYLTLRETALGHVEKGETDVSEILELE